MTPEVLRAAVVMVATYLSWQVIYPVVPEWGIYIISILAVAAFAGAAWYVFASTRDEGPQYPSTVRSRAEDQTATRHSRR
jgi:hypothetical protein